MKKLFTMIVLAVMLISCNETAAPKDEAVKLTLAELRTIPSYYWFDNFYYQYTPDSLTIELIKQAFNPEIHRFWVYTDQNCQCAHSLSLFACAMRVFADAGITGDNYELFSMPLLESKHDHQDEINISYLPALFVLNNNTPYYSVIDSVVSNESIFPDSLIKVEYFLLDALKQ